MKLDEIQALWEQHSKIDATELGAEALKIPQLHNVFFKILSQERLSLRRLEAEARELRRRKFEFYTQGPTEETHQLGWVLPPSGKIIKSEVSSYIDSDPDITTLSLRVSLQQEKVDFLVSIISTINNRGYHLKVAVDWERFKVGL